MAISNELAEGLKKMSPEDKKLIFAVTNKYVTAQRSNGNIRQEYDNVVATLKNLENKYQIQIFPTGVPEATLIKALAAKVEATTQEITGGKNYSCAFAGIDHANAWLMQQKNIIVKKLDVETSRVGLDVKKVVVEYCPAEKTTDYKYQITEFMKHRLFVSTKPEKVCAKWKEKNPQYRLVSWIKRRWAFHLIGGSVGFFRYVKEKYILLYAIKNG